MNQKFNWTRRRLTGPAGMGIPVRFEADAAGFEVKIKNSAVNTILDLEPLLVPGLCELRASVDCVEAQAPLPGFKRAPAMASITLHVIMLDERRFEAALKMNRKKRC